MLAPLQKLRHFLLQCLYQHLSRPFARQEIQHRFFLLSYNLFHGVSPFDSSALTDVVSLVFERIRRFYCLRKPPLGFSTTFHATSSPSSSPGPNFVGLSPRIFGPFGLFIHRSNPLTIESVPLCRN